MKSIVFLLFFLMKKTKQNKTKQIHACRKLTNNMEDIRSLIVVT